MTVEEQNLNLAILSLNARTVWDGERSVVEEGAGAELDVARHAWLDAIEDRDDAIRAAVEEEREALIPAIEEAALTLTEYHIKLPEQLARALEDRDG